LREDDALFEALLAVTHACWRHGSAHPSAVPSQDTNYRVTFAFALWYLWKIRQEPLGCCTNRLHPSCRAYQTLECRLLLEFPGHPACPQYSSCVSGSRAAPVGVPCHPCSTGCSPCYISQCRFLLAASLLSLPLSPYLTPGGQGVNLTNPLNSHLAGRWTARVSDSGGCYPGQIGTDEDSSCLGSGAYFDSLAGLSSHLQPDCSACGHLCPSWAPSSWSYHPPLHRWPSKSPYGT
jgi:hypothetical protein